MAIKLETFLYIAIFIVIAFTLSLKQENKDAAIATSKKELEFTNSTFSEVNTTAQLSQAFTKSGIQENGVLTLNDITYSGQKLKSLKANRAVYDGNISTLYGNVVLKQESGFEYTTDKAIYDINKQFIYVPNSFLAKMNDNTMNGKDLKYNISTQNAEATNIHAILYTKN
jgi:lipopolysaccharide assembly outer membrane protein LptD (OstA)